MDQPQNENKVDNNLYVPVRIPLKGIFVNADENCYLDFRPPVMSEFLEFDKVFSAITEEELKEMVKNPKLKQERISLMVNFIKKMFLGGQHKNVGGDSIKITSANIDQIIAYCLPRVRKALVPSEVNNKDFTKS